MDALFSGLYSPKSTVDTTHRMINIQQKKHTLKRKHIAENLE